MSKAKPSSGDLGWHFFRDDWRKQTNDKKIDTGLNLELSGMVREATQNSNDAKLDDSPRPAKIHYRLLLLSGPAKDRFLAAGQLREISERIKAGTKNPYLNYSNSGLKARLNESNERLQTLESSVLPVLVITDSGTKGLKGEDSDKKSSFHTYTHTIGRSQDKGDGKGGSHGVGKGLLWELSAFRTIFLSTVDSAHPERGPRFYGVANNVEHTLRGNEYSGVGFFGAPDKDTDEHALSVFSPDQGILDALFLETPKPSGLSICIPGLIPADFEEVLWYKVTSSRDAERTKEVAKEICNALIDSFWPALVWKRFEATVTCEVVGSSSKTLFEEKIDRSVVNSRADLQRLSHAIDKNSNGVPENDPEKGFSSHALTIRVPKGHHSSSQETPQVDAKAVLVLAHLDDAERRSVQSVRGTGMVIDAKYLNFDEYQEGSGWAGMLLAGTAALNHRSIGDTVSPESAKAFDQFLTLCEGATHSKWSASEQAAAAIYKKSPTQATLRSMRSQVRDEIRATLQGVDQDREDYPAWFDIARIIGPTPPGPQRYYMVATDRKHQADSIELTANFNLGKKKSSKPLRLRASLINEKGPTAISLDKISNLGDSGDLRAISPASGELQLKLRFSALRVNPSRAGLRVWLERDRDESDQQ